MARTIILKIACAWLVVSGSAVVSAEGGPAGKSSRSDGKTGDAPASYGGVTLHGGDPPTMQAPAAGLQAVTWPGFRTGSGGSEVFLQLTGSVAYKLQGKGRLVQVLMEKTSVPLRNNLRPVITSHFPSSPVSEFRLRPLKADRVRLDIKLRRRSVPTVKIEVRDKYTYLVVSFPPSSTPED